MNRLAQAIRDAAQSLVFWLLVIIGGGIIIFALRGGVEQPAPLSEQPVSPARPSTTPTPPSPPLGSAYPAGEFPAAIPFSSPTPPPAGATINARMEGVQFPTVTPPGFDAAYLTQSPTPMPPPSPTPIVPHTWGALGLVGVSESVGGEPEAIIAGSSHLFVVAEDNLVSLDGVGAVPPLVTGRVALPEKKVQDISRLAIQGATLLVAHQDAGLVFVDIADSAGMQIITTYWPEPVEGRPELEAWEVVQVVVEGSLAYVLTEFCPPSCATGGDMAVVDVLDISNPAGPKPQTRFILEAREPVLAMHQQYVFVGDGDGKIHIYGWEGEELVPAGEPIQLTYADGAPANGVDSLQPQSGDRLHVIGNGVWWVLHLNGDNWEIGQGPVEMNTIYDGGIWLDGRVLLYHGHLGGLRLLDVSVPAGIQDLGAYGPAWGLPKTGYTQPFAISGTLIYAIDGNGSINVLQIQGP